jgi:hypothetical protein
MRTGETEHPRLIVTAKFLPMLSVYRIYEAAYRFLNVFSEMISRFEGNYSLFVRQELT